ncbi:TPA: peptide deformylase [Candidatus Delongbacteria bacterium]|nr:MAG: peptide deformylase [Candidatus Delongbacteria bacterium GWF2_40_14]HAQ62687.1 peptide deformylase [Candidatus Delongbacteria bacterium]
MEIRIYGDEVLNKRAEEVAEITTELKELIGEMIKKCPEANGIGLAAPQVGVSKRFFVVVVQDREDDDGKFVKGFSMVFINPVIKASSGSCKMEEGCLSVPGIWEIIERPEVIEVEFTDIEGRRLTGTYEGLLARVIQHENDHLDGILFVSKLPKLKQDLLKKRLNALKNKKRDY